MNGLWKFDHVVFRAINVDMHRDWLDPWFLILSYSGLGLVQAVAIFCLLIWKETRRFFWPLILTLFVAGIPAAQGVKALLGRDRPSNLGFAIRQEDWLANSFPSGHSMLSAVVYLTIGTLLASFVRERRVKFYFLSVALALTFLVGVSRVFMGVNYPTDVLAGWSAGLVWALICWLAARYLQRRGAVESDIATGPQEKSEGSS